MGVWWLVKARRSERAALHYVLTTRCRLCLEGKDGRPTQFNIAIACSVKLTSKELARAFFAEQTQEGHNVLVTPSLYTSILFP